MKILSADIRFVGQKYLKQSTMYLTVTNVFLQMFEILHSNWYMHSFSISIEETSVLIKALLFWCAAHIYFKKLSFSNWKTTSFNPFTEKPSFSIGKPSFWSSARKSLNLIANVNCKVNGKSKCPVSHYRTSF